AYAPDGRAVLRVLGDRRVEVAGTAGSLAYVRAPPSRALHVVDLERGRVTVAPARPRLLLEDAPRAWGLADSRLER
ncbi:MAG: hypothetical protein M3237_15290, partial [Actinomycetota bacterium]|nr:hypothetical protein [Actinomycetota bacterium]